MPPPKSKEQKRLEAKEKDAKNKIITAIEAAKNQTEAKKNDKPKAK